VEVYCPAGATDSVSWPSTLAGTFFTFSCKDGYYSALPCSSVLCVQYGGSANWATLPSCQGYCFYHISIVGGSLKIGTLSPFAAGCPGGPTVGSSWDTTKPNSTATGQCYSGFFSPSNPQRFCNPDGTWEEIENECVDSPLGQAADWLPFVISGVVGAASVITYFFARKRNPDAQNFLIRGSSITGDFQWTGRRRRTSR